MQISCFECELRACGLFKPVTPNELGAINEIKRDHIALPAGSEIIQIGDENPEIYTLYSGWAFRFQTLPDGRRQILNFFFLATYSVCRQRCSTPHSMALRPSPTFSCACCRGEGLELFGEMPGLAFDVAWLGSREESHVDGNLTSAGRRTATERAAALISDDIQSAPTLSAWFQTIPSHSR